MAPSKLVVVGNGMAGVRAIEEVSPRRRGRFDITVFGDEPYGNYNRTLLSNVLALAVTTRPRASSTTICALTGGLADDKVVVCPLHGHTFDLSTGCEAGGNELSVRSYPVAVVDGTVRISLRRA